MCRLIAVAVLFVGVSNTFAQPIPRLTVLTPAGGQAGTTVQLTLAGVDLDVVSSFMIAPAGITGVPTPDPKNPGIIIPPEFTLRITKNMRPGPVC